MSEEITNNVAEVLDVMTEIKPAEHPAGIEMEEWTFTNDKTNPGITQLFHMFHDSVFKNKVGLMHAKIKGGNEVHTLLVGVEVTPDNQILTWPIAKILTEEEQNKYAAPDGNGNWLE